MQRGRAVGVLYFVEEKWTEGGKPTTGKDFGGTDA